MVTVQHNIAASDWQLWQCTMAVYLSASSEFRVFQIIFLLYVQQFLHFQSHLAKYK